MADIKEFRLPDVGEGLTEADIVRWHVKPGDHVTVNQIIVEIETAKAVVELPSPYEGTVDRLLVAEASPPTSALRSSRSAPTAVTRLRTLSPARPSSSARSARPRTWSRHFRSNQQSRSRWPASRA
jgi:biotin-dependent enzyme